MAKAESIPTTTRRGMLTGGATAVLTPPTTVFSANPDAALIRLGRELTAIWATQYSICKRLEDIETEESDDAVDAAVRRTSDVVRRILLQSARTLDGLKVKAAAVSWCWGGRIEFDAETTDMKLVQSMLIDLLAMSEA